MEMPVNTLDRSQSQNRQRDMNCPGCGNTLRQGAIPPDVPAVGDAFDRLAKAWRDLDTAQLNYKIEFVVKTPEPTNKP